MDAVMAARYAEQWIADWCRRDIASIVSHYTEDATFVSPLAAKRTGSALVKGQPALSEYWSAALAIDVFEFKLEYTVWDDARQELVIVYTRNVGGRRDRACELVSFDEDGLVRHGEAMYGAELPL